MIDCQPSEITGEHHQNTVQGGVCRTELAVFLRRKQLNQTDSGTDVLNRIDRRHQNPDHKECRIVVNNEVTEEIQDDNQNSAAHEDQQRRNPVQNVTGNQDKTYRNQRRYPHDVSILRFRKIQLLYRKQQIENIAAERGNLGQAYADEQEIKKTVSQAILDIHLYQYRHSGQKRRFLLISIVHRRIFPFFDEKADPGDAQQDCHGKPGINAVRIFPGILQKEKVERSGRTSQNHHQDRNEPADEHMRNHIRIQIEEDRTDEKIEKLENHTADDRHPDDDCPQREIFFQNGQAPITISAICGAQPRSTSISAITGAATIRKGMRRPQRVRVRSLSVEITGFITMFIPDGILPTTTAINSFDAPKQFNESGIRVGTRMEQETW